MLMVDQLSFSYKNHPVLDKISFSAQDGELVCLLGENGAGKTTLFKCILGFLSRYQGRVLLDGRDLRTLTTRELAQQIAYIPQAHAPAYNYTASDVVLMGTTVLVSSYQTPGEKERTLVREALAFLGISHLGTRGYAQLSGGERQLVLIARALVQRSKLLIMDEPTANLDYGNQLRVMEQIRMLSRQGYTVLLSTHNPDHALHFADKVLVLDEKRTLQYGAPDSTLSTEIIQKIYGVATEIATVTTSWGQMPLLAPRLRELGGQQPAPPCSKPSG